MIWRVKVRWCLLQTPDLEAGIILDLSEMYFFKAAESVNNGSFLASQKLQTLFAWLTVLFAENVLLVCAILIFGNYSLKAGN